MLHVWWSDWNDLGNKLDPQCRGGSTFIQKHHYFSDQTFRLLQVFPGETERTANWRQQGHRRWCIFLRPGNRCHTKQRNGGRTLVLPRHTTHTSLTRGDGEHSACPRPCITSTGSPGAVLVLLTITSRQGGHLVHFPGHMTKGVQI